MARTPHEPELPPVVWPVAAVLLTGVAWLTIGSDVPIIGILSLALAGGCAVRALRVCPGVFGREAAILAACVVAMSVGVITYALATAWR